jgi:hypothetical protein
MVVSAERTEAGVIETKVEDDDNAERIMNREPAQDRIKRESPSRRSRLLYGASIHRAWKEMTPPPGASNSVMSAPARGAASERWFDTFLVTAPATDSLVIYPLAETLTPS